MLVWVSTPVFAQACFILDQPPKPIFSKQGSTTIATYTVTGNVINGGGVTGTCDITDFLAGNGVDPTDPFVGYTYVWSKFEMTNVKALSSNCTGSIRNDIRTALYTLPKFGETCRVSFNMVYPFTGSYTGNDPLNDKILTPRICFKIFPRPCVDSTTTTQFTNPITIPSEPARTCKLIHPDVVKMVSSKPSDYTSPAIVLMAGSFSVTLSCQQTTSARSGTPRLKFIYPSALLSGLCLATNQADPAVASPVLVQIKRTNNAVVCGDSAIAQGSEQNFATFSGTGAYNSTLDFKTLYFSQTANPAPGPFTASVTLQVSYP